MGFYAISFFKQLMCFWIAKIWFKQIRIGGQGTATDPITDGCHVPNCRQWVGIWGYLTYAKEGKYIGQVTRAVRKMNHKRAVTGQPIPGWIMYLPTYIPLLVM